jgi:hypothetical protein
MLSRVNDYDKLTGTVMMVFEFKNSPLSCHQTSSEKTLFTIE